MTIRECKEIIKNEKRHVGQIKSKIKKINDDLEDPDVLEELEVLNSEMETRLEHIQELEEYLKKLRADCK